MSTQNSTIYLDREDWSFASSVPYMKCEIDRESSCQCHSESDTIAKHPAIKARGRVIIDNKPRKKKSSSCLPVKSDGRKRFSGIIKNFLKDKIKFVRAFSTDRSSYTSKPKEDSKKYYRNSENECKYLDKIFDVLNPTVLSQINEIINSPNIGALKYILPYLLTDDPETAVKYLKVFCNDDLQLREIVNKNSVVKDDEKISSVKVDENIQNSLNSLSNEIIYTNKPKITITGTSEQKRVHLHNFSRIDSNEITIHDVAPKHAFQPYVNEYTRMSRDKMNAATRRTHSKNSLYSLNKGKCQKKNSHFIEKRSVESRLLDDRILVKQNGLTQISEKSSNEDNFVPRPVNKTALSSKTSSMRSLNVNMHRCNNVSSDKAAKIEEKTENDIIYSNPIYDDSSNGSVNAKSSDKSLKPINSLTSKHSQLMSDLNEFLAKRAASKKSIEMTSQLSDGTTQQQQQTQFSQPYTKFKLKRRTKTKSFIEDGMVENIFINPNSSVNLTDKCSVYSIFSTQPESRLVLNDKNKSNGSLAMCTPDEKNRAIVSRAPSNRDIASKVDSKTTIHHLPTIDSHQSETKIEVFYEANATSNDQLDLFETTASFTNLKLNESDRPLSSEFHSPCQNEIYFETNEKLEEQIKDNYFTLDQQLNRIKKGQDELDKILIDLENADTNDNGLNELCAFLGHNGTNKNENNNTCDHSLEARTSLFSCCLDEKCANEQKLQSAISSPSLSSSSLYSFNNTYSFKDVHELERINYAIAMISQDLNMNHVLHDACCKIDKLNRYELMQEKSALEQILFQLEWDFGCSKLLRKSFNFISLKKRYELVRALLDGVECKKCGSRLYLFEK